MDLKETTHRENLIYNGKILKLYCDDILLPSGDFAKREYVSHSGGVTILPIDQNGDVVFVRQFRYAYKTDLLELPAGKKELGEDPKECGLRELSEEIGAEAGKFEFLAEFYPSVGYTNEVIYIYTATDLTFSSQHLDKDEFLNVERYPLEKALQMVLSGEIKDGKTVIALLKYNEMKNRGK